MTDLCNTNIVSMLSPDYIEKIPFISRFQIKRKFFTFDYYGKIINSINDTVLFHFKLSDKGFIFQGLDFSWEWIHTGCRNWSEVCSGKLMNQYNETIVITVPYECNEVREYKFVVRKLFQINTLKKKYKLWCTTELNWISENIQRLLVLSDDQDRVIMRGRTESFSKIIDVINDDETIILIPVFFNYMMLPPMPAG
jgi:hypothetical protein